MSNQPEPIERQQFDTQQLVMDHPPRWEDRNKKIVFAIACPAGTSHRGRLDYSRWAPLPWPESLDPKSAASRVVTRPGFYDYARTSDRESTVEWHVNFADPSLFVAYGSRLFAQDEMQVAEHPVLGSLKEALIARNLRAVTVDGNQPTPVLVMGALRHCRVTTEPNAAEGRPHGLYGNAFARADSEAVRHATTRIDPPTTTNLVAIAAPSYGAGRYRMSDLEYALHAAFTGFRAAVLESARSCGSVCPVVIHSGFWGCGAFGGNRVLMTTLQVIAVEMAGVEQIVFHTGDPSGAAAISEMRRLFDADQIGGSTVTVREVVERIHAIGFEWGVSDGN